MQSYQIETHFIRDNDENMNRVANNLNIFKRNRHCNEAETTRLVIRKEVISLDPISCTNIALNPDKLQP